MAGKRIAVRKWVSVQTWGYTSIREGVYQINVYEDCVDVIIRYYQLRAKS